MAIEVTLGAHGRHAGPARGRWVESASGDESLHGLFEALAKHHPDLAPLLEDAEHAPDLEIYVNDRPVRNEAAPRLRLHDGDHVSLFLK